MTIELKKARRSGLTSVGEWLNQNILLSRTLRRRLFTAATVREF